MRQKLLQIMHMLFFLFATVPIVSGTQTLTERNVVEISNTTVNSTGLNYDPMLFIDGGGIELPKVVGWNDDGGVTLPSIYGRRVAQDSFINQQYDMKTSGFHIASYTTNSGASDMCNVVVGIKNMNIGVYAAPEHSGSEYEGNTQIADLTEDSQKGDFYTLDGVCVAMNVCKTYIDNLPAGIYVFRGKLIQKSK